MRSGVIGLIGRPNAGKSTLLNTIMQRKIAIVSNKAQTTRNIIMGFYTDEDCQIVFMDTPGIHKPKHKLGKILNKEAYNTTNEVDVILYIVDASSEIGSGDKFIIDYLKDIKKPVILVLNKIDKLDNKVILDKISTYSKLYNFSEIVPVCALKDKSVNYLLNVIKKYLTSDFKLFEDDTYTNVSLKFLISEYIREKVLMLTYEEVPHSVTCITDSIESNNNNISISATIVVDRDNLKKIIIGKNGEMIKKIGIMARRDIEALLGKKVYLDLFVKVVSKWKDKSSFLKENGFYE